ncbi:MAG: DNA-directed DNA polymerase [archaeon]
MEISFIPLDYDYFELEDKNYVKIYGRSSSGKRVCIIDNCDNYFYVLSPNLEKLRKKLESNKEISSYIKKLEILNKNYLDSPVKALKIIVKSYKHIKEISEFTKIADPSSNRKEIDISIITRYIIESKILPLKWYKISGRLMNNDEKFQGIDSNLQVDFCIELEKCEKIPDLEFLPKILAFDIEAAEFETGKGEILMISLVSESFKKVITWKKTTSMPSYVEYCKDEREMLKKFVEIIKKQEPDIIVGYYSDGFDMPYIKGRASHYKLSLPLNLDNSQPRFSGGRLRTAKTKGIVHIDLLRFIQPVYAQYLKSETLSLNEVSSELLGEKKIDISHLDLNKKMKDKDWNEFFEYNLQDSILAYKLTRKLWPDMQEFTKLVQEPLHKVSRNTLPQHLEDFIIHNTEKYNEIIERSPIHEEIEERRARKPVEGAFVMQPTPGLYENLAVFDFTSMHTSIIISMNISKSTLLGKKEKDCYESPEVEFNKKKTKFYFSKKQGFLPSLFNEILEKRKKYKQEYKANPDPITKARSNAFKLLSASAHGYIGFFGARYYSLESSASILAFVRKFNKEIIEKTKNAGYQVIYGDTDSIAFSLNEKTEKETLEFLKKLNSELPGVMELELEGFFKRGIWVTKRTGDFGAKKKYALIDSQNKLKVRGFETVRRDWCMLAREMQNTVLEKILKEGNEISSLEYVKEIIAKVKSREIDRKKILIRTQLRKPISEYKSISPHVIAARKMHARNLPISPGSLIEYFIAETREKKKLVRDKVKLPDEKGEYNIQYYLENQILPAVENILDVFNINIKEIIDGRKQTKLDGFKASELRS